MISDERTLLTRTSKEFLEILNEYSHPQRVSTHCHWKKKHWGKEFEAKIGIDVKQRGIDVDVNSEDLATIAGLHDKIAEYFQAKNPPIEKGIVSRYDLKPTIFLAHRFDEQGKSHAESLKRFLSQLGFEVMEGESYESRDIPSKVVERILSQDIFICLVTEGEHAWITSEVGFAKGQDKYIIILVQDGLDFKKGIIGSDYEHMTFPEGVIEKTYSDLLYALPSK